MKEFLRANLTFISVILGTLVLLIGGVFLFSKNGSSSALGTKVSDTVLVPPDAEITSGIVNGKYLPASKNATVTIVEFGDYQCPACGAYNSLVKQILTDLSGKINFVFRDFSFIGPESLKAAEAASCASDQNKFWEFHDYLYSHQNGENKGNFNDDALKSFAKDLGLEPKSFATCLDSGKYKTKVESSTNDGKLAGVNSTPTFFVNGYKMINPGSYEDFKKAIEDALKNNPISQSPAPESYHIHFDLKVYMNGSPLNLALDRYQSTDAHELNAFIHLHDGNAKVVHVHKQGMTIKDLFDSWKLTLPSGILAYVNGKKVDNISSYVPQDLDQILIGSANLSSVSNDACIYSLKCPERGTPPTENCVGGLGTDCKD